MSGIALTIPGVAIARGRARIQGYAEKEAA